MFAFTASRVLNHRALLGCGNLLRYQKPSSVQITHDIAVAMASRRSARLSAAASATATPEAPSMPPPTATARSLAKAAGPASRKRKAAQSPAPAEPPTTPKKQRARRTTPPPATPTPSAVGLIAQGIDATPRPPNKRVARLANPEGTNAPLLSPETSRIVAKKTIDELSPTKKPPIAPGAAAPTTTANILEEACAHLIKVDERMRPLVEKNYCCVFSPEGLAEKIDPFESLASGIISQQVSGAAAKAIKARFVGLFTPAGGEEEEEEEAKELPAGSERKRFPLPSQVAATSIERLRTAGLSQRKAEYVQGLAQKFVDGELTAQLLADAPYEEVLERLIAVRGLGKWSVEMFATFGLKRMDVFSLGDLGVQRGMAAFVGRDVAKLKSKGGKFKYMSEKDMEEMAEPFRPYRSVFMWYMWRVEETDISTME